MGELQIIIDTLNREYGLSGKLSKLVAYEDINYRLDATQGGSFVVKITMDPSENDFILSQNKVLLDLSGDKTPSPYQTKKGNYHVDIKIDAFVRAFRLFPFIEGKFLAEIKPDAQFFSAFGELLGNLDKELESLAMPVLKCQNREWDLARFQEL